MPEDNMADPSLEAAYPTVRVVLIGGHPHAGLCGTVTLVNGKMEGKVLLGSFMRRIVLDENKFGIEACFAEDRQIRRLREGETGEKIPERRPGPRGQVTYPRR